WIQRAGTASQESRPEAPLRRGEETMGVVLHSMRAGGAGRRARAALLATLIATLMACGGSKDGDGANTPPDQLPSSRDEAAAFLAKATFGPNDAAVDRLMAIGYAAWVDEQLAMPATSHRANWEAADAAAKAADPDASAGQDPVFYSFWKQAV